MAGLAVQAINAIFGVASGTPQRSAIAPDVNAPASRRQAAGQDSVSFSREARAAAAKGTDAELDENEQAEVQELKRRDREVRQHEQAHVAAGGEYVQGGPQFSYTTGPDGRRYATGGEVRISVSPGRTPEESLRKARVIRRAALAPAEPSGQDRQVAAQAARLESQARRAIAKAKAETGDVSSSVASEPTVRGLDISA